MSANSFAWTAFYGELAAALSALDGASLLTRVRPLAAGQPLMHYLHFDNARFWSARDGQIDPFTVMAIFNRNATYAHRHELGELLGRAFGISAAAPVDFTGIPFVDARRSIYDGNSEMWRLWRVAMKEGASREFAFAFDAAIAVKGNALGNLSIGLFWARPLEFMPIDAVSRPYLERHYGLDAPPDKCTGMEYAQYLAVLKSVAAHKNATYPEIAHAAREEQATPGR